MNITSFLLDNIELLSILSLAFYIGKKFQVLDQLQMDMKNLEIKLDNVEAKLSKRIDEVETKLSKRIDDLEIKLNSRIDKLGSKITKMDRRFTETVARINNRVAYVEGKTNSSFTNKSPL